MQKLYTVDLGGAEIARPDNAAPDQTVVLAHCWIEHAER